jgi:hypothetical protein
MGSPISGLIAEIFLQHNENKHIKQILDTKHTAFYTRYVDDILVIYDSTRLSPQDIHTYINGIHQNIKLKATPEENSAIDFLDLTITRIHNRLQIDIHRKPTATDTTINFQSNHPTEQKIATYRHHINRMYNLPLDQDKRQREWETIKTMGKNNDVPSQVLHKLHRKLKHKKPRPKPETADREKWTTFTYHSPKIRAITNLFKNTNINIAFKPATTTEKYLRQKTLHTTPVYDRSGVYTISCKTCQKTYVGQTSRMLRTRHQEHIRYIRNNDPKSAYSLHILNQNHEYGPIQDTMKLIKGVEEQTMLLPLEQLYIHTLHNKDELIPEQTPQENNPIYEILQNMDRTSQQTEHTQPKTKNSK